MRVQSHFFFKLRHFQLKFTLWRDQLIDRVRARVSSLHHLLTTLIDSSVDLGNVRRDILLHAQIELTRELVGLVRRHFLCQAQSGSLKMVPVIRQSLGIVPYIEVE